MLALPHGAAMQLVPALVPETRVIDLGADFRFRDAQTYEQWYATPHACPDLLDQSVYGLTEVHRGAIRRARIVGNPGCYPTAALLAILPLLQSRRVRVDGAIVDAKSGVSGAGRGLSPGTHFAEVNENVRPYNVSTHRHTPEIEQEVALATVTRPPAHAPAPFCPSRRRSGSVPSRLAAAGLPPRAARHPGL